MKLPFLLVALLFFPSLCIAAPQRPNILFLAIDDLRPELGCYGDTIVESPHIDQFAREALLFERAYCQVAVCGASRASMMTGILPTPTRYIDFLATVDEDTPKAMTLPQFFKENGYTTLANGKVLHMETDAAQRSWSRPVQKSSLPRLGDSEAAASQHKQQKKGKGFSTKVSMLPIAPMTTG